VPITGYRRNGVIVPSPPGYGELARVFTGISLLGFGGPNAHLALMLDEVVERRRWVTREHFLHLVAVTNLLPGPNSSEVVIHVGYTQRGWRGGLVSGLAFMAPTFVFVVVLSALYFRYGAVPAVEQIFWGLKPVIVAIILGAGWKLGRTAVTDLPLFVLAAGGLAVAVWLDRWEVAAMAAGGLIGWLLYRRDAMRGEPEPVAPTPVSEPASDGGCRSAVMLLPALSVLASGELVRLFLLMLGIGSVLFGGGYMLIALLQPYVVGQFGWLTADQFLDGIALTQAVPGPIVTFVAFVGYAVGGIAGAALAILGIYLPSFAAVFGVAPFLERWRHKSGVQAVLMGVNAVVSGAILGVAVTLTAPAVPDVLAGALLAGALAAQLRFGVPAIWLVTAGLLAGVVRWLLAT
jgi:chromate transporter